MPASTSPLPRLALRASLLGGVLLDSALALAVLNGWGDAPAISLSYPPMLLSLIGVRLGVQALACYDRRRFDPLIPLVGLSWIGLYLLGVVLASAAWTENLPTALLGLAQCVLWRATR